MRDAREEKVWRDLALLAGPACVRRRVFLAHDDAADHPAHACQDGTTFLRWRADKPPRDCTYEQLEVTPPYELARVFGA